MAGRVGKVAMLEQQAAAAQQDFERQARAEAQRKAEELRAEQARAKAEEFMRANGLKTTDEARAFVMRQMRMLFRQGTDKSLFERWCDAMKQVTVDWLVLDDGRDGRRALERLRDAGVIDEVNRLIPKEQREAAAAQARAQRALVDEELRRRAMDNAMDIAGQA